MSHEYRYTFILYDRLTIEIINYEIDKWVLYGGVGWPMGRQIRAHFLQRSWYGEASAKIKFWLDFEGANLSFPKDFFANLARGDPC